MQIAIMTVQSLWKVQIVTTRKELGQYFRPQSFQRSISSSYSEMSPTQLRKEWN